MAKNKISEYSSTPANNTDIAGINIAEGCAPSGINNAIRELMAQLKDQQTGSDGDNFTVGGNLSVSGTATITGATTFSGAVTFGNSAIFSSGVTFSSSAVMSGDVTMNGTTNNIGTTTSSTILSGSVTHTSGSKLYLDSAATTASAPPLSWSSDTNTGIYRPAADTLALVTGGADRVTVNSSGILILGSGEATTTPTGNILRSPNASGTNIAGSDLEITAGNGTGTGGSGKIVIKTADVGSSGSSANTMTQRLAITPKGGFSFGSGATSYGVSGQVLRSNGDAPPSFGSAITAATSKSASGSATVEFTDIPAHAKRVTVMVSGLSTASSGDIFIQFGTSSGYESTGYTGTTVNADGTNLETFSAAYKIAGDNVASNIYNGVITFVNLESNTWVEQGILSVSGGNSTQKTSVGIKGLTAALSKLQLYVEGSVTFDAGTVNIIYE